MIVQFHTPSLPDATARLARALAHLPPETAREIDYASRAVAAATARLAFVDGAADAGGNRFHAARRFDAAYGETLMRARG